MSLGPGLTERKYILVLSLNPLTLNKSVFGFSSSHLSQDGMRMELSLGLKEDISHRTGCITNVEHAVPTWMNGPTRVASVTGHILLPVPGQTHAGHHPPRKLADQAPLISLLPGWGRQTDCDVLTAWNAGMLKGYSC